MLDFEGIRPSESIESFHDRVVNPDTEYIRQCGRTIDGISTLLKDRSFGYKVMRTIKGGSVGKGTAVRDLSDVDLIFPIYDIRSVEHLRDEMGRIFQKVRETLESSEYACSFKSQGTWAIIYDILINGKLQEVDIIPIANMADDPSKLSDSEMDLIHRKMKEGRGDIRIYLNRCLRPVQVDFIGKKDPKIKMAIRLIKYWIKTKQHTLIKSITAELLVIRAWEDLGKPHPSEPVTSICKRVFEMLRNIGELKIYWTKYYDPTKYEIPSVPYILDPVDPYNNVISYITDNYYKGPSPNPKQKEVMEQVTKLEKGADYALRSFGN